MTVHRTAPYDTIIGRLRGVRRAPARPGTTRAARALCPHHQSDQSDGPRPGRTPRTPSLSIAETDGGAILLHCHAGCAVPEIAGAVGMDLHDLFPAGGGHRGPGNGGPGAWTAAAALADDVARLVTLYAVGGDVDILDVLDAVGRFKVAARSAMRAEVRRAA